MACGKRWVVAALAVGVAAWVGAQQQEGQKGVPPGMSAQEMAAMVAAGTPGEQHKAMAKGAGVWKGKGTMWMSADAPPVTCDMTSKAEMILGGRHLKIDVSGEMPGMGQFNGMGIYGFDNVIQKPVSAWVDSMSTGIIRGEGEVSEGGKVITYRYTVNCPIRKKAVPARDVETYTSHDAMTLESFGSDVKTGQEFRMMKVEMTRERTEQANGGG